MEVRWPQLWRTEIPRQGIRKCLTQALLINQWIHISLVENLLIICLRPLSMTLTYSNIFIINLHKNKENLKIIHVDHRKLEKVLICQTQ